MWSSSWVLSLWALSSHDVSLQARSESVYIVHKSECKVLLKTPSLRRAAASVDPRFHNNNQSLFNIKAESLCGSLLPPHQSEVNEKCSPPALHIFLWIYSVVTLLCYCAVQDARQVRAAARLRTAPPIMSELSECEFLSSEGLLVLLLTSPSAVSEVLVIYFNVWTSHIKPSSNSCRAYLQWVNLFLCVWGRLYSWPTSSSRALKWRNAPSHGHVLDLIKGHSAH